MEFISRTFAPCSLVAGLCLQGRYPMWVIDIEGINYAIVMFPLGSLWIFRYKISVGEIYGVIDVGLEFQYQSKDIIITPDTKGIRNIESG